MVAFLQHLHPTCAEKQCHRKSSCCFPPKEIHFPHPGLLLVCCFPCRLHPTLLPEGIPAGFQVVLSVGITRAASTSSAAWREPCCDQGGSHMAAHYCRAHPDRQPEEQEEDGSTVSAPEGPLQHFNLAWLWFLAGLGNSELRMSSMGPELALDPSSGAQPGTGRS